MMQPTSLFYNGVPLPQGFPMARPCSTHAGTTMYPVPNQPYMPAMLTSVTQRQCSTATNTQFKQTQGSIWPVDSESSFANLQRSRSVPQISPQPMSAQSYPMPQTAPSYPLRDSRASPQAFALTQPQVLSPQAVHSLSGSQRTVTSSWHPCPPMPSVSAPMFNNRSRSLPLAAARPGAIQAPKPQSVQPVTTHPPVAESEHTCTWNRSPSVTTSQPATSSSPAEQTCKDMDLEPTVFKDAMARPPPVSARRGLFPSPLPLCNVSPTAAAKVSVAMASAPPCTRSSAPPATPRSMPTTPRSLPSPRGSPPPSVSPRVTGPSTPRSGGRGPMSPPRTIPNHPVILITPPPCEKIHIPAEEPINSSFAGSDGASIRLESEESNDISPASSDGASIPLDMEETIDAKPEDTFMPTLVNEPSNRAKPTSYATQPEVEAEAPIILSPKSVDKWWQPSGNTRHSMEALRATEQTAGANDTATKWWDILQRQHDLDELELRQLASRWQT